MFGMMGTKASMTTSDAMILLCRLIAYTRKPENAGADDQQCGVRQR